MTWEGASSPHSACVPRQAARAMELCRALGWSTGVVGAASELGPLRTVDLPLRAAVVSDESGYMGPACSLRLICSLWVPYICFPRRLDHCLINLSSRVSFPRSYLDQRDAMLHTTSLL